MRKQKCIVSGFEAGPVPAAILPIWICRMPKLKIKSGLVIEITQAVRKLDLTQEEAGRRMGVPQPQVLLRRLHRLSERKLMDCLNRRGMTSKSR